MSNQAYLESIDSAPGQLTLYVVLVTDSTKIPKQFIFSASVTRNQINQQIQSALDSLNVSETTAKTLVPGLMDLTVIPPDPPNSELVLFNDARILLRKYQNLVNEGILQANDAAYTDALAAAVKAWQPGFIDLIF